MTGSILGDRRGSLRAAAEVESERHLWHIDGLRAAWNRDSLVYTGQAIFAGVREPRGPAHGAAATFRGYRDSGRYPECGAIAQLGERLLCKQEVTGSNPVGSIELTEIQGLMFADWAGE